MINVLIPRVYKFLSKRTKKKGWNFSDAPDERQEGKVDHQISSILWALEFGFMSNQPTLRDVEEMTEDLGPWARQQVPDKISDTTMDTESRRLDQEYLLEKLVLQVRDAHRSKMLKPVWLPCGVATVDGKNLATLDHDADGTAHKRSIENVKWHKKDDDSKKNYWLMPALRSTLTSAEAKPCIYQMPIPPKTGESSLCEEFVNDLHRAYGRSNMFGIIDFDAGFTSLANADHVDSLGYGYVFGLKGNQNELFAEAKALLIPLTEDQEPEAQTPWERRSGKQIRRSLWRTDEMRGMENSVGVWKHLRQTWLVRQESKHTNGTIEVEDRYFLTSILWNYLKPLQIFNLVRGHWGIENDSYNSLDLQWKEDDAPWCTKGKAIWVLGLLRLMAYNVAQYVRKRRLRRKDEDGNWKAPLPWRSTFKIIVKAIEMGAIAEPMSATIG
ncbi:MAG: transposase [bacterium]